MISTHTIDVVMMATPEIEHYASTTKQAWARYCRAHNYQFVVYDTNAVPDLHINWSKIEHARRHINQSECEWMVIADADTLVCKEAVPLTTLIDNAQGKGLIFSADMVRRWHIDLPLNLLGAMRTRRWTLPNAGFFIIRNDTDGKRFMNQWMDLPRGRLAHLADVVPRDQLALWLGLLPEWQARMHILGPQVLRVLNNWHWNHLQAREPDMLIRHDKRLK